MPESNNLNKAIIADLGKNGTLYAGSSSTSTGAFDKIIIITDTIFKSVTASGIEKSTDISSDTTFPALFVLAGKIEEFIIKTGSVLAYKSN